MVRMVDIQVGRGPTGGRLERADRREAGWWPTGGRLAGGRPEGGWLVADRREAGGAADRREAGGADRPERSGPVRIKSGERSDRPSESAPHTIRQFLTFSPLKIPKNSKIKIYCFLRPNYLKKSIKNQ
jgi:hypothetical protein